MNPQLASERHRHPTRTEIEEFRMSALTFLGAHAEPKIVERHRGWGTGSDAVGLLDTYPNEQAHFEAVRDARNWRRTVFDAGFGWLGGPTEFGGAGRSPVLDEEYRLLESRFDVPDQQPIATGTHLVAPSIDAHGTEDVKRRYLPGLFRGDLIACQLLSEPNAGSDLAGLTTRAVRDGDAWVVTGQKVWTSQAHLADVGQLLARTDSDVAKHRGLTMFLIDMQSPGITVRPLRQMTGDAHFNEVFLDIVRVPDRNRVGELGAGWGAVMATLTSERAAVGSGATNSAVDPVQRLRDLARHRGVAQHPVVRQQLAELYTAAEIRRWLVGRHQSRLERGQPPGPEGSILKLAFSDAARRVSALAGHVLGPSLGADTGDWGTFAWSDWVLGTPMISIAGGTDEIQRNILAERTLGLPKEPN